MNRWGFGAKERHLKKVAPRTTGPVTSQFYINV